MQGQTIPIRMENPLGGRIRGATVVAVMCLAALATTQEKPKVSNAKASNAKIADRLVRELELDKLRSASAKKLVRMGDQAVPAVIRGLGHPKTRVVVELAMILRAMGKGARTAVPALQRIAKGKDADRAHAARWALVAFEPQGITLVADMRAGRIVEFDKKGKEVLEIKGLTRIVDAERLPNGHYLVALLEGGVKEIDKKGAVHWSFKTLATRATRLPGGNTLICSGSDDKVIEVDPAGKVEWEVDSNRAVTAQRLADGNTLIAEAMGRGVVEVSPDGKVVWKCAEGNNPMCAQRLENGNTLVVSMMGKRVAEIDRNNKVVRVFEVKGQVLSAIRLPGGDTLIGGNRYLHRLDAKGKLVGKFDVKSAMQVKHY